MKRTLLAAVIGAMTVTVSNPALAWSQNVHKRIVLDAINYMKTHPSTTNYNKLLAGATRAGYTIDSFANVVGQGAYDVDDFADTYLCGASSGSCVQAPVWGLGSGIVKYTSYWHFQNHTQGQDVHGNDLGGYNYAKLGVWGDIDNMAASWLYGDYLDDGKGNMKGWFGDSTVYNSYDQTEAHYRLGGYSTRSMYADFEKMPFQPIDNLGQYWFQQFLTQPTAQTIGFVLHTTDLLQPHHTWTTSALNHSGWETWVENYYDTYQFNAASKVDAALANFTPLAPNATDIRPLLTQGGDLSYSQGGIVLSSTDDADRRRVADVMIPNAIAMTVHVLNRAAERF
jgi:hypothetical protein